MITKILKALLEFCVAIAVGVLTGVLVIALLIMVGMFQGCASTSGQALDASKQYRMDLEVDANGVKGYGALVVPANGAYRICAHPRERPDLVVMVSCHREQTLGRQKDDFCIDYSPTLVEQEGYCPLELIAFSQKLWYQGALIIPATKDFTAPAIVTCNGALKKSGGVSECQSRAGLIQRIRFETPMNAGIPAKCAQPVSKEGGLVFEFRPVSGQCAVVFREKTGTREHLLSLVGYDEYLSPR